MGTMFYVAFSQCSYIDQERRGIYNEAYEYNINWYYFFESPQTIWGRNAVSKQGGVNFRSGL